MEFRSYGTNRADDLWGQLEGLLHQVWVCERQWRIDDRFDLLLASSGSLR
jgi:hypothetical protein